MVYVYVICFLVFQVVANVLFKWGAANPSAVWLGIPQEWCGFILGNVVGMTSIIFMIGMYKLLPAASVVAIGTGGTFLLVQITMFLLYHEKISLPALIGIALIFIGVLLVAFLNYPPQTKSAETATDSAEVR